LKIPNALVLALVGLFVLAAIVLETRISVMSHIAPAAGVFMLGAILFYFNKLGGGDVKFLAAASLWIGAGQMPGFLVSLGIGGVLVVLLFLLGGPAMHWGLLRAQDALGRQVFIPEAIARRGQIPYGVSIAIASLVVAGRLPLFV
ncbi:MAG: prepilin peptidase, partial [Kiloniellaceae bacterium]